MSLKDQEVHLVLRCRQGDREAFRQLVDAYKKPVYNLALLMVNNREDAADIAQETFLRVFRHIGQFDPRHRFSSWIFTIASRLCLDRLRRLKRERIDITEDIPDRGPLPEEEVIRKEVRHELDQAIAGLPEKYRLVVVLRHFNDLSYEEISSILEIPVNTVKTHLFRGRDLLKQTLKSKEAGEYSG